MPKSGAKARMTRRAKEKRNKQLNLRLSGCLTYISEMLKSEAFEHYRTKIHPIFKVYPKNIIPRNGDMSEKNDGFAVIKPGMEQLLPKGIHPKDVRHIVFDGFRLDMDDKDLAEWMECFDSDYIMEWVNNVCDDSKMQDRYTNNRAKYHKNACMNMPGYAYSFDRRDTGINGCGCLKCRGGLDGSKMSNQRHRARQIGEIEIEDQIRELKDPKYTGRKVMKNISIY